MERGSRRAGSASDATRHRPLGDVSMSWRRRFRRHVSLLESLWALPRPGSRARCNPRLHRLGRRRAPRGAVSVAVLAIDGERSPDLDRRCDSGAHRLRRHGDRARRADGDGDVLGPHPASLVPRPPAEGDPRGSRWHLHVLVLGAPADRRRLRPGPRRDTGRAGGLAVLAGLHRLLRSVHPPAEAGGGGRGRRTRSSFDVRADGPPRRPVGHPVDVRVDTRRSDTRRGRQPRRRHPSRRSRRARRLGSRPRRRARPAVPGRRLRADR